MTRTDLIRPPGIDPLLGDAAKAKRQLGRDPTKPVEDIAAAMIKAGPARHRAWLHA